VEEAWNRRFELDCGHDLFGPRNVKGNANVKTVPGTRFSPRIVNEGNDV
jgi:hypothetical protein